MGYGIASKVGPAQPLLGRRPLTHVLPLLRRPEFPTSTPPLALPRPLTPTHTPATQGERFTGAISAVKARAPVLGGNFGVWGGMFSTFDCAVKGYRQKEDPWNAIISGFLTGGSLALRGASGPGGGRQDVPVGMDGRCANATTPTGGPRTAFGSAVGCAILLGVFEGIGVLMGRMFAQPVPAIPRESRLLLASPWRCLHLSAPHAIAHDAVPEAPPQPAIA